MSHSQPFDILLAHDRWATRQLFEACVPLSQEKFQQPFEMGPGSLQKTTTHLLGAMRRWTDTLRDVELRPRIEEDGLTRTPAELLALLGPTADDFAAAARAHPLDGTITAVRGGQTYTFNRGAIVTHVMTHSMHHRAQCLNMLRHVGVSPLPLSSVLEWIRSGSPEK